MKKIITLVLIVAVFISCFAVPVNAFDTTWLDLLEFYPPNNSEGNYVSIGPGEAIHFDVPPFRMGFVDFVCEFRNSYPTEATVIVNGNSFSLTAVEINPYVWRYYGSVQRTPADGFDIVFNNTAATTTIQFISFRVTETNFISYNSPISGELSSNSKIYSFSYNSASSYTAANIPYASSPSSQRFYGTLDIEDWKKFDYLSIQLELFNAEVSGLTLKLGSQVLPFEYNFVNDATVLNESYIDIFIDLTQVQRTAGSTLKIEFSGSTTLIDSGSSAGVRVSSSFGYLEETFINETFVFFYRLSDFLTEQFNRIGQWFSDQTVAISTWLESIFNALSPDTEGADEAVEDAKDQANDMNDLTDQMGAMEKPDLSGGGDISGIVSPENTVKYTVFLNHVVTAPYIGEVVMLCLILSLAAYVLFGKR